MHNYGAGGGYRTLMRQAPRDFETRALRWPGPAQTSCRSSIPSDLVSLLSRSPLSSVRSLSQLTIVTASTPANSASSVWNRACFARKRRIRYPRVAPGNRGTRSSPSPSLFPSSGCWLLLDARVLHHPQRKPELGPGTCIRFDSDAEAVQERTLDPMNPRTSAPSRSPLLHRCRNGSIGRTESRTPSLHASLHRDDLDSKPVRGVNQS